MESKKVGWMAPGRLLKSPPWPHCCLFWLAGAMTQPATLIGGLILIGWMGSDMALGQAPALVLAEGGKTSYVITVASDVSPAERHAAEELAAFLKQISGAEFIVTGFTEAAGRPQIAVGPVAALAAGMGEKSLEGLGDEGILIRTLPPHLVLTGGRGAARGTLYAVYAFLEEMLGCRWWTPKASRIPKAEKITLAALDRRYIPPLEYREIYYFDALDGDWSARNRLNGNFNRLAEAQGGHHLYKGFVHTFEVLVPEKEFFETHSAWFSLVGGQRRSGGAQLCLTARGLGEHVTTRVKEWLAETPAATIVSVSQNDRGGACKCPKCRAVDQAEGSPAGTMLRFVNGVAKEVEKDFPKVAVDTLAYQYTRKPPRAAKPRPNVIVRLCSIECNFGEPLTGASNRAFREDIKGWSQICKRLYVWDYVTNFAHYLQPNPNWNVMGDNIRFFVKNGVKGIFEQGNYQSPGGEMAELRAWVLAKLLWDPSRDTGALIREFLEGYYEPAALHIEASMRCLSESVARKKCYLGIYVPPTSPFLTPAVLKETLEHLAAAEKTVAADPELTKRVERLKLPAWYVILSRWNELPHPFTNARGERLIPNDKAGMFDAFSAVFLANGMTHVGEPEEHRLEWFRKKVLGAEAKPAP